MPGYVFTNESERMEYENRPKHIVSQMRANKLYAQSIQKQQIATVDADIQLFTVTREKGKHNITNTVSIKEGFCSCYHFVQKRVPCQDMYAVLHHFGISFHALPPSLLNQPHLKIQSDCIVPNIP
eukprot:940169_1